MTDIKSTPIEVPQARTVEIIDGLFRRGMPAEELCARNGVSDTNELWRSQGVAR